MSASLRRVCVTRQRISGGSARRVMIHSVVSVHRQGTCMRINPFPSEYMWHYLSILLHRAQFARIFYFNAHLLYVHDNNLMGTVWRSVDMRAQI